MSTVLSTCLVGYFGVQLQFFRTSKQEGLNSGRCSEALACLTTCGKLLPVVSKSFLVLIWDLEETASNDFICFQG